MSNRIDRINELLKRELSLVVERHIAPDVSCLITVTEIKTSNDLRHAKAYISVYGSDEQKEDVMKRFVRQRKDIQQHMMRHVKLKFTPVLEFQLDERFSQADKVLRLLDTLDIEPDPDAENTEDT